ncbi:hypothetical protein RhiirB3_418019 [Rhizophagus irregularis]|nr:hypothetical protein RhiirB3_418019 [Rhizophagus irregularis]
MDILYLLDKKRNIIGFLNAMDQHSTFSIMIPLYIFEGIQFNKFNRNNRNFLYFQSWTR